MALGVGILGSGYMGRTYAFGLKEINHDARLVDAVGDHEEAQPHRRSGLDRCRRLRPDRSAVRGARLHQSSYLHSIRGR